MVSRYLSLLSLSRMMDMKSVGPGMRTGQWMGSGREGSADGSLGGGAGTCICFSLEPTPVSPHLQASNSDSGVTDLELAHVTGTTHVPAQGSRKLKEEFQQMLNELRAGQLLVHTTR